MKYHFLTGKMAKTMEFENDAAAIAKAKALQAEFDKAPEGSRVQILRVQNDETRKHIYENVPKEEVAKAGSWE